ncbi:hypothetical protein DdX_15094 [Ditylenchus destructor]|uniref:Uncharacterized protein n=1 Tax=Ditylenchus destructor TaxID=166010 RepID=A0AAD4MS56_9BILA|nr:hypothetical protein DdX_15094 [Ditylenchus destructor]
MGTTGSSELPDIVDFPVCLYVAGSKHSISEEQDLDPVLAVVRRHLLDPETEIDTDLESSQDVLWYLDRCEVKDATLFKLVGDKERHQRGILAEFLSMKKGKSFDELLNATCFAYNTSVHVTTGDSPFFLMFGRTPVMNIDVILNHKRRDPYVFTPVDEFRRELLICLRTAWTSAAEISAEHAQAMEKGPIGMSGQQILASASLTLERKSFAFQAVRGTNSAEVWLLVTESGSKGDRTITLQNPGDVIHRAERLVSEGAASHIQTEITRPQPVRVVVKPTPTGPLMEINEVNRNVFIFIPGGRGLEGARRFLNMAGTIFEEGRGRLREIQAQERRDRDRAFTPDRPTKPELYRFTHFTDPFISLSLLLNLFFRACFKTNGVVISLKLARAVMQSSLQDQKLGKD